MLIVLAVPALAGCGGGGSSSAGSTTEPAGGKQAGAPATTATEPASGGLTPPGTKLALGEKATVAWVPFAEEDPTETQAGLKFEAVVESVEKKSTSDLAGLELEPDEEEDTPYFVTVKLTALGAAEPPAEEQPALTFTAIDDRGQEQEPTTVLGEFPNCEEELMPAHFSAGQSYTICSLYLIRPGGSIASVEWNAGPHEPNAVTPYFESPLVWEAG